MSATVVPPAIAAYAAGIYTGAPEASWEDIAAAIEDLGGGRFPPDVLAEAAQEWARSVRYDLSNSGRRLAAKPR
jgi:hypothetical protein